MKRSERSKRMGLLLAAISLVLVAGVGYAQVGGGFDLSWNTINGGGGTLSTDGGATFSLGGAVGQPGAGSLAGTGPGGQFTLDGGFWGGAAGNPAATQTPATTPTRTPTLPAGSTPTNTSTQTRTATRTGTPTITPTGTIPTATATETPSHTASATSTNMPTVVGATATATTQPGATPSASATACPVQFSDVPEGSTFYPYIRCMACRGIVNGYSDGTFRPNNNVTRGQLSKIVSNSAGFSDPQTTQMFQDVPPGSTFFDYIGRLASRGYINGYDCGGPGEPCVPPGNLPYFRTNNNATRGQITKIVSNAAGFNDPPSGQIFEDVPPASTFYTYTQRLASRGVMQGYQCGSAGEPCVPPGNLPYFRTFNNATRGQTSKIVANTFFPNCDTPQSGGTPR